MRFLALWHELCNSQGAKEVGMMTVLAHNRGSRTILVADDDTIMREYMKHVLQRAGYAVIEASDGQEAIEKFSERQGEIGLVVLDVLMPRKNGWDTYRQIDKMKPGIRAIFVSGYTKDVLVRQSLGERVRFISKPFELPAFLDNVRESLDSRCTRPGQSDCRDAGGHRCCRDGTLDIAAACVDVR